MQKLWAVVKREYLERVRSRWFVVATVFGPFLFALLMFAPAYFASRGKESTEVSRIRILDATGTTLGSAIAAELNGGPFGDTLRTQVAAIDAAGIAAAESLATNAVRAGQIKGYLVLEPSAMRGRGVRYSGTNATALADMRRIEQVVRGEVFRRRLEAAGVPAADAATLRRFTVDFKAERLTARGRGGSGRVNILFAITVAMLLYATILIYGQNVLRGVLEEKLTRVAEVVVSSVPATTLLGGKVLGVGAVGLTQMLAWSLSTLILVRIRGPLLARFGADATPLQLPDISIGMFLLLMLFFLLGYTLYSSLFAAVGAMVSSEQDAQQAQLPIVLLLVMSVAMMQSAITEPDGALATNLSIIPFSAPIAMPLRLSTANVPPLDIVTSIALLTATCWLAVFAAGRIYRTGLLMYGKRPTIRELARWVAQSR